MPAAGGALAAVAAVRRAHQRRIALSLVVVAVVAVVAFAVAGSGAAALAAPIALVIWLVVALPALRRRYAAELDGLPPVDLTDR
jgi:hypothetical protein